MGILSFLTKKPNDPDPADKDKADARVKPLKIKQPAAKKPRKIRQRQKQPIAEKDYAPDLPAGTPNHVVFYRGWFREQYKRMVLINLLMVGLLVVSFAANIYLFVMEKAPVYYAATSDFRMAKLEPLDRPLISQSALLNWTAETVSETLSLDFLHWRKKLMRVRERYSTEAFNQLIASLKESGNLDLIRNQRLSVSVTTAQAPIIIGKGNLGGRIVWRIEVPVTATYESSTATHQVQRLRASIVVERVSTLERPAGIQVRQMLLKTDDQ